LNMRPLGLVLLSPTLLVQQPASKACKRDHDQPGDGHYPT
jgi:hypothetical protein